MCHLLNLKFIIIKIKKTILGRSLQSNISIIIQSIIFKNSIAYTKKIIGIKTKLLGIQYIINFNNQLMNLLENRKKIIN